MISSTTNRKIKNNAETICRFYPFLFIRIHSTEKYLHEMELKGWRVYAIVLGAFIFFEKSKPCYSEYYFCITPRTTSPGPAFKDELDKVFGGSFERTPEPKYTGIDRAEYQLFRTSGYDNNKFREAKKLRKKRLAVYEIIDISSRIFIIVMAIIGFRIISY